MRIPWGLQACHVYRSELRDHLRIRWISIKGLFGSLDHDIPLFQREPITIIHGPNGVGKTSILKLVSGALKGSSKLLRSVPFAKLSLGFDEGSAVEVTPETLQDSSMARTRAQRLSKARTAFRFQLVRDGQVEGEYIHSPYSTKSSGLLASRIEQWLPHLDRVGPDRWLDPRFGRVLSFEEVVRRYGPDLPEEARPNEIPGWLADIQKSTPVHFIETQRLLATTQVGEPDASQEAKVKQCATELAGRINQILAQSATLSQTLERSFPTRLISGTGTGTGPLSESETRAKLHELDQKRSRLVEAGLLDPSSEPNLPAKRFDDTTQRVLGVYIADTEQKLHIFDDMLSRIELIKSIVDARFLQKRVLVNRQDGFAVLTRNERPVDLSGLSSGEQHELVLLYELLFRAEPNTLILIDEPELSLHIAWQQKFLKDLLQITRLARLQALVATHSPQIVHDRWDLAVELLGPN
jgi:energy-coupling factor transporter ATP-binding protein EcfA2